MEPIHILLVEDNEGDIFLITEALHESKITNHLSTVRDGWEAIQFLEKKGLYAQERTPDLILLDVNLPKMNGHEVLVAVKSNESIKHIPVIMLTTSSSEKDIYLSYKNYVNCYITKPIDAGNFLKVVTSIENFWISIVSLPKVLNN